MDNPEFLIYQSEKNKRKEGKTSTEKNDAHSSHESKDRAHNLLDVIIKMLQPSNTLDLIARDINELKLLQGHRDAIKNHSLQLTNKMINNIQPLIVVSPPRAPTPPPSSSSSSVTIPPKAVTPPPKSASPPPLAETKKTIFGRKVLHSMR